MNQNKVTFRVLAVSTNSNSFGLYQHVLVDVKGRAFKALRSRGPWLDDFAKGSEIILIESRPGLFNWAERSFECPEALTTCPERLRLELWPTTKVSDPKTPRQFALEVYNTSPSPLGALELAIAEGAADGRHDFARHLGDIRTERSELRDALAEAVTQLETIRLSDGIRGIERRNMVSAAVVRAKKLLNAGGAL